MKNAILSIVLLLVICSSAYSQKHTIGLEFGPKFGIGTSTYKYTGEVDNIRNDFAPKSAFLFGAYSRLKFRRLFVQPEVFWTRKGMKGLYIIGRRLSENVLLHSDYVASTALLGLELDRFSIGLGPELGINFSNTVDGQQVKDLFETKADMSFNFSIGFRVKKYFRLSGRYNYGLEKLWKVYFVDTLGNLVTEADIRQHAFLITLSYNLWR